MTLALQAAGKQATCYGQLRYILQTQKTQKYLCWRPLQTFHKNMGHLAPVHPACRPWHILFPFSGVYTDMWPHHGEEFFFHDKRCRMQQCFLIGKTSFFCIFHASFIHFFYVPTCTCVPNKCVFRREKTAIQLFFMACFC